MAADCRKSKGKRTRKNNRRKLLVDEKVEMRSREDGFLGSWHSATVICCEDLARVIRFDHLLSVDGSDNLIEHVVVTPVVDGIVMGGISMPDNHRGTIRPFPPPCISRTRFLHYGQCVDFFYEDAWWEGVVFDHEDGNEQRRIFFPDMGDEMEARVDMLRISQDWDEVSEEWKPRGNWLFLELVEEVEQDWPLPVSAKQIWYEVRVKSGFEKLKEWTSSAQSIWRELVLQVLFDNFRIIIKQLFKDFNSYWDRPELGQLLLKYSEPTLDAILKFNGLFHNSPKVVSFEPMCQLDCKWMQPNDLNNTCCHQAQEQNDQVDLAPTSVSAPALPILSHNPDEASGIGSDNCNEGTSNTCFKSPSVELSISPQRKRLHWKPAIPVLVSGAEFCPNAVAECTEMYRSSQRPPSNLLLNARKHLLHLDWNIEFADDKGTRRVRYHSPDGELFFSLRQVCLKFKHFGPELTPVSPMLSLIPTYGKMIAVSSPPDNPLSLHVEKPQCLSELAKLHAPDVVVIEPEYCPPAISDYYVLGSESKDSSHALQKDVRLKALKAKKHLSATGWSFYYHMKRDKREMRYSSPSGKTFYSLRSACKWCIEVNAIQPSDCDLDLEGKQIVNAIKDFDDNPSMTEPHLPLISMEPPGNFPLVNDTFEKLRNESCDMSTSKGLLQLSEVEAHKTGVVQNKRKRGKPHYNDGPILPKRGRKSHASKLHKRGRKSHSSMKVRGDMAVDSTPVVRSSRTREVVVSSSHQTPRTVLSWLIDNNVVLPRAKVQYRGRKDGRSMAEGRITRDGIKCNCCHKIFTLSSFEVHAGSTNHRPSANIFFEDGKSLSKCISLLKQRNGNRRLRSESGTIKASRNNRKNDYICSVCHYGGELILCDQCPSSFHARCVGLKEIPDGDWFCPSCCCGTCGQGGYGKRNDQVVDSSILICGQCERQYHIGCLRNKEAINLDSCPDGHWFCQDTCKQIFYSLHKILGKPIFLGTENLAWTLVQHNKTDSCGHDASDNEDLMENYSKLNVALSVMHECFEPVKEPGSRRDLVEDVIFSRWSELKRLNFQGFYTVLLEKNDELISAATVRIYGKRVAEVPFIATRFQYRRLGMCRILMDELEKKLTELGVERLVLPAVPSVLNTWTTSFGFSMMNESERLNLLDCIFLDFQGTVICQKVLKCGPSSVASLPTATREKSYDHGSKNVSIELDGNNSSLSEVFQADQAEKTEIVEQGSPCVATGATNNNDDENGSAQLAVLADQPTALNYISSPSKISPECPVGVTSKKLVEDKNSAPIFKCYKRRRISAC